MISAGTTRRFVGTAFFPMGSTISEELGLGGMSLDVQQAENHALAAAHGTMWGNDALVDDIHKLAQTYLAGVEAAEKNSLIMAERCGCQHLTTFAMSVLQVLGAAVPS